MPAAKELGERLSDLSMPEPMSGCWLWLGARRNTKWAYGLINIGQRALQAHRVSYEFHRGPIPDGLQLDHLCRTPECINPWHLEPVTNLENGRRGISADVNAAIQKAKIRCKAGHLYDTANTYFHAGKRDCRICQRQRSAEWKTRNAY